MIRLCCGDGVNVGCDIALLPVAMQRDWMIMAICGCDVVMVFSPNQSGRYDIKTLSTINYLHLILPIHQILLLLVGPNN